MAEVGRRGRLGAQTCDSGGWGMGLPGELESPQIIGLTGHVYSDPGDRIHPILRDAYHLKHSYITANVWMYYVIETQNSYAFLIKNARLESCVSLYS